MNLRSKNIITLGIVALLIAKADSQSVGTSPQTTVTTAEAVVPPIKFHVLERRKINLADRSIILNRVAPPDLPEPPPAATPLPTPTAEQVAAYEAELKLQKKYELLCISATVYDHQVTVLRWSDENGSYLAYSNIDFMNFEGQGAFETSDTIYELIMLGVGEDSRDQILAYNRSITPAEAAEGITPMDVPPSVTEFSRTHSEYIVVEDAANPVSNAACAAIDAMHIYYDANKEKLIADHAKMLSARLAKEAWDKEHPPIPKDTVVNFWPVKSTVYPTAEEKETSK